MKNAGFAQIKKFIRLNLKNAGNGKLFYVLIFAFLFISCEKEKDTQPQQGDFQRLDEEQISAVVESSTVVSTQVQSFLYSSIMVAIDSGYSPDTPPDISSKIDNSNEINQLKASASISQGWTGPDANGWYTLTMEGIYDYTEKVRIADTVEHIKIIEYHGGDGSYSNTTTTKYIPYFKNEVKLYKGYSIWEVEAFGDNNISRTEWRIEFEDWNPATNAGIFDWFWGVSENNGGNTVPMHRYEHLEATETDTEGWLHCHIICYDDSGTETWDFEYDTPWAPVYMPEIPNVTFD